MAVLGYRVQDGRHTQRGLVLLTFVALAGCTPDIGTGTYFCGPERNCPPQLQCDDNSYTCVDESMAQPFVCPSASENHEPDDTPALARDLGTMICGESLLPMAAGCLTGLGQVDHFTFVNMTACAGQDPHLELTLQFPTALVPLKIEVLDGAGNVLAVGDDCTPDVDFTGTQRACIEMPTPQGAVFIRISVADPERDCNGDCHFNSYMLDISHRLS